MNVTPVKKYRQLRYPDKQTVLNNPKILKTIPERWKGNVYVGTALTTLLMFTLTACTSKGAGGRGIKSISSRTAGELLVAPVFEHGNGRGSFGCDSVAPPSFLSEEEAFQVVQEEGKKYGIIYKKNGLELKNVRIPETKYYLRPLDKNTNYNTDGGIIDTTRKGELILDGFDTGKKVGFEFVSTEDYSAWKIKESKGSTVQDYDFISTARVLTSGLENKNGEGAIGVFYNPMVAGGKSNAAEELRKQVKDFLQWLKAQGIM